jgi:hypothetical protein
MPRGGITEVVEASRPERQTDAATIVEAQVEHVEFVHVVTPGVNDATAASCTPPDVTARASPRLTTVSRIRIHLLSRQRHILGIIAEKQAEAGAPHQKSALL